MVTELPRASDDDAADEAHDVPKVDCPRQRISSIIGGVDRALVAEDSLAYRKRAALFFPLVDMPALCEFLHIRNTHRWHILDGAKDFDSRNPLGIIRMIAGHAKPVMQMECKQHKRCRLMLYAQTRGFEVEAACVKWLLAGLVVSDQERHQQIGNCVKSEFNR